MKAKFIKFMKQKRSFAEFKIDIFHTVMSDLDAQFKDGGAEFVLEDGCLFFYKDSQTGVNWKRLSEEWVEVVREERDE